MRQALGSLFDLASLRSYESGQGFDARLVGLVCLVGWTGKPTGGTKETRQTRRTVTRLCWRLFLRAHGSVTDRASLA